MSKSPRTRPSEEETGQAAHAEQLASAISVSVMKVLGRPADLFRVSVVKLWGNHYRVNVQTGADPVSVRIAHSFFLTVDDSGQVTASEPAIARVY